ncbi:8-oxoguanine DNA glycosylase, partial [Candidatus Uhrbacteria bacterium]|nr:8-oxoguanine DNA glycosylase [Candidatus Uhrbacteria bacterium]
KKNDFKFLSWHLNLDKDYSAIIQSINRDQYMDKAIKQYWGLRELRQPLFETLISYIISINKSIKQISRSIEVMAQTWGQSIQADGRTFYSFPEAKILEAVSEKELAQVTRVGFRAKYIKKVV